ncbi:hypothetical protein MPC1_4750004 [Methylocella tundrae]|nr:hypothetical protein MPC1_4750004 [Methylocella tundrae]
MKAFDPRPSPERINSSRRRLNKIIRSRMSFRKTDACYVQHLMQRVILIDEDFFPEEE